MIIREGTTNPGHRRIVLLILSVATLATALAVTLQTRVLQGAVNGYQTTTRVMEVQHYQSGCNECLDTYVSCTSLLRKRHDYSDERIAIINRQCAVQYKSCRNRVQCVY